MRNILDELILLHKQALTEKSHYYVATTALAAIEEICDLRAELITVRKQQAQDMQCLFDNIRECKP